MKHLLLLACVVLSAQCASAAPPDTVVRVGVVAFDHLERELTRWRTTFSKWEQQLDGARFRIALGTHSDVLHWMQNDWVDLVVLPAGALAFRRASGHGGYEYLATLG